MSDTKLRTVTYRAPRRGRRALLCLLLGAAILGVSWQVQTRLGVARPFSLSFGKKTDARDGARVSREIALPARTLYALQLGAFTQENAANQLAQEFSARGAAGCVCRDGDAYRVLAAAYPTRAEAQAVQTRLNAQNISTYIHPCAQEGMTLRAGGTAAQVEAFSDALSYLTSLDGKLYTLSCALDARQLAAAEARDALLSEAVTSAALCERLLSAFGASMTAPLSALADTLRAVADTAETVRADAGAARIGAALKRGQLAAFLGVGAFCEAARSSSD